MKRSNENCNYDTIIFCAAVIMPTMNKDSDWETIIRQILKVKSPTMSLPILSCGKTAVKFFSNPR